MAYFTAMDDVEANRAELERVLPDRHPAVLDSG
jgi:hypothetical protein